MEATSFPSATFAEFYRFALLLTGNVKVAEHVMADTLAEVEAQLAQFRNETSRRARMATRIRERCSKNNASEPAAPRLLRSEEETQGNPEILEIEAFLLAQRFHTLPEPERSALALFYLDLFDIAELSQVMKMSEDALSETLDSARGLLKQALSAGVASPPAV